MKHSGFLSRAGRGPLSLVLTCLLLASALPGRAEIIINEVMAINNTIAPLTEFPDYFPDYLELYNDSTTEDVDLGLAGYGLTTKRNPSIADPEAFFHFPVGSIVPKDGYLLVFMDNKTNFPGIHAAFNVGGTNPVTLSISGDGDEVLLCKDIGALAQPPFYTQVDACLFGMQVPELSVGRVPEHTGDFTLTYPSPCGGPGASIPCLPNVAYTNFGNPMTLKINEWLVFSAERKGDTIVTNRDWFEIYNPDTNIVVLSGLVFADKGSSNNVPLVIPNPPEDSLKFVAPLSYISPQGFVQIFCLGAGQGQASAPDEVNFSLSSTGGTAGSTNDPADEIWIFATNDLAQVIDHVILPRFSQIADNDITRGRLPDGGDYDPLNAKLPRKSPKESNFGTISEIVINEILTHTDPPLEDAIELMNVTNVNVNISGWWISNQRNNAQKYRFPAGTIIPAGGYKVVYEKDFNGPNAAQPFTLNSANGDELYLFKGNPTTGALLGYRRGVDFGPAENGVSFGRYTNSAGQVDFTTLADLSFGTSVRRTDPASYTNIFRTGTGAPNSGPKIGPVVINEIHYNPTELYDDVTNEFIEILNISDQPVLLYDPAIYRADKNYNPAPDGTVLTAGEVYADGRTNTWRLRGEVDFNFPADNLVINPGQFFLVVNFDPSDAPKLSAFTNKFGIKGVPTQVKVFGPYGGSLANGGGTIELRRPDAPQAPFHPDFRLVPYIQVDRVSYNDFELEDVFPWPATPDGQGHSLQRISSYAYGNDPLNWRGDDPTPGAFNSPSGLEPPSIRSVTIQPASGVVAAGGTISATVSARGGSLTYQWYADNDNPLVGQSNPQLRFQNALISQAGGYYVVVENPAGSITSSVVHLTIVQSADDKDPTVAITAPSSTTIAESLIIVRGTAKDNVGISNVSYSVNGGTFIAATGSVVSGSVTWASWGTPFPVSLEPGTNIVRAYSVDHSGRSSATVSRSYFQSVRSPLGLVTNGIGGVKGATNGQGFELGRNFSLTALPSATTVFSNWIVMTNANVVYTSASPVLTYMMRPDLKVIANFVDNPFIDVAGKYNGLFYDEGNFENASSGFFTLTVTARGTYTASILNHGRKLSSSGQLDLDGNSTKSVLRKGTNDILITWNVNLNGSNTVSGSVSNADWTASLTGDRAYYSRTTPYTNVAKYTFTIPGTDGDDSKPHGDGYGTASIDASGMVSLKGYLSDKTAISQKVPISQNGEWPFFVQLYSKKGSVFGWLHLIDGESVDFEGDIHWFKPPSTAKYYPAGFEAATSVQGSRYVAPVGATNRILNVTNAQVTFSGGDFAQDYVSDVILGLSNKVTNNSPQHRLVFSFTLPTGLFKGNFTPTNGTKATVFNGAVLQKSTNGFGYFLGTNESGRVTFQPKPAP